MQGNSPHVQVEEPYGNIDMVTCRLSSSVIDKALTGYGRVRVFTGLGLITGSGQKLAYSFA